MSRGSLYTHLTDTREMPTPPFQYQPMFPVGTDRTEYELITSDYVHTVDCNGHQMLQVEPEALRILAERAMHDVAFYLRTAHQEQVASILSDPEASDNDKFVALTFLRNAEVSALGQLPFCQDTGTAIILGKKGQNVWTGACDEEYLSHGVYDTYTRYNLRYSQNAPLDMYREVNTGCNLPAQIDLMATEGDEYKFLFIAKGGGSANKTYLYQETKALLTEERLFPFLVDKMRSLGTAACPPYHIAFVIGGTSAEANLKTVKLASAKYYDELPTEGNELGHAFRDLEMEQRLLEATHEIGLGAQFGGKYFAHDIRVIRMPRHGASCPVGLGVSCSADRNVRAKINKEGLWIERLEKHPARLIPEAMRHGTEGEVVKVDLNRPMDEIRKQLSQYPVSTRLSLSGTIVVGRDIAHAKLKERLDRGEELPQYIKDHPIYYAGPAKTPEGMPSGSFGPTTAGRMDPYVDLFQSHGGSLVMIAKGNRSQQVTDACKAHGGFYLGSIGGPAAILAQESIKRVECLEYPELGMEAIWRIEVEDFPAFILVDDKGNDFFQQIRQCAGCPRG
ncbi:hydro-lyase, Fe-S type, tartrate/fumarate subfamily, beta subunit [Porphyromonas asaccharolytica DSM 20707]|uniref:Fumarate hydratase class I n=2 Tax=Porphyromonas asaccharolytica TaxID=28123 RepID=F4KJU7_PORAD|nr:hydro-lyase, Fe-S type, tartrate/fumarate subfamily, beta subunit [Porphyromonas asaccharolytica DSM 20707]